MNKKISHYDFQASLNRRLSGLKADPYLSRRIMAQEKKTSATKRKTALLIIAAAVLVALATGALAYALDAWGIIDFAGRPFNTYVPPRYEDSIARLDLPVDTGFGRCVLQEAYYDGKVLRLTAEMAPNEKMLFISGDVSPSDPVDNPEYQGLSIAQYALQCYDGHLSEICLSAADNETCALLPNENGSFTLYLECIFDDEQTERETEVKLICIPIQIGEDDMGTYDFSGRETAAVLIPFHAVETRSYTCVEEMAFPEAGVKVIGVALTVTPLEIRYTVEYEVVDLEVFSAQQGGLWFDFVRADDGVYQRVSDGLYSSESCGRADGAFFAPDEVGTVYRQTGALGLDNMSGRYAIRAYNAWDKTLYEVRTFSVKEKED